MLAHPHAVLTLSLTAFIPTLAAPLTAFLWHRAGAPENDHSLSINPKAFCKGQVVNVSWVDTEVDASPFKVQVGVGGYYSGVIWRERYENLTEQSMLWPVDADAGDSLIFQIADSLRTTAYLQNFVVRPDEDCTNATKLALSNNTSVGMNSDSASNSTSSASPVNGTSTTSSLLSPNATSDNSAAGSDNGPFVGTGTRHNSTSHPLVPSNSSSASLKASITASKSSSSSSASLPPSSVSISSSPSVDSPTASANGGLAPSQAVVDHPEASGEVIPAVDDDDGASEIERSQ
ncbi:hypothetical protein IAR50_001378 [Cryptococcus sp. DSM 104548]